MSIAFSRAARALFLASALGVLASCGGEGGIGPTGDGRGSVSATGDATVSGSGLAAFYADTSRGTNAFQVGVAPPSPTASGHWGMEIVFFDGRPAAGTYALAMFAGTQPVADFYYAPAGGTAQMFHATSGQVVIASSSPSLVQGTVTFSGTTYDGSQTVQVTGEFAARCLAGSTACP